MNVTSLKTIYQLKVSLQGSKPPIWRRILVASNMNLADFHETLQITMGWTDCHLHQFISARKFYGVPDDDFGMEMEIEDENLYKLSQLLKIEKDSLIYEYDFGDSWEHKVTLEKILSFDDSQTIPRCIKGKRACPPEDCGGIWGYHELLETICDPDNPEHEEMLEWLDGDFDSEYFTLREINQQLKSLAK